MEGHTLVEIVLRGLHDLQISTLELVVESHGRNLTGNHRHTAGLLRLILVVVHFGHGVNAGHQVVDLNLALGVGLDGLIDAIAGNGESKVVYLSVLRGLDDLSRTVGYLQIEKCLHGVIDLLGVADDILSTASGSVSSIRPSNDSSAGCTGLACSNSHAVRGCGSRRNDELVSADAERNAILIRRKAIIGKDIVAVSQSCGVVRAVPSKLDILRLAGSFRHKAGNSRVTLYACFNAVVVADELAIQRVRCADNTLDGIIAAGTDMIEVLISLTDHGFPNKNLRRHRLCQCFGIACVLRTPRGTDRSRVAVLHNTTDEQFHIVGRNSAVEIRGEVIPKGFILAGVSVASVLRRTRLNAVADISVIRVHCSNGSVLGLTGIPTVHIVKIGVSPSTAVVEICITASRKRNEIDFRLLSCGKGGSRAKSDKCGQAHHERKQSCNSSLEKMCFHCVDYLLENEKRTVL